jgi:hypothetical protein
MMLPLLTHLLLEVLPVTMMARLQLPKPSRHQVSRTRTPSSFIYCNNAASSNAIAVVFDIARDSSRLSPRHQASFCVASARVSAWSPKSTLPALLEPPFPSVLVFGGACSSAPDPSPKPLYRLALGEWGAKVILHMLAARLS